MKKIILKLFICTLFSLILYSCDLFNKKDVYTELIEKADNGNMVEQYNAACIHFAGSVRTQDFIKANYYLHKSAKQGYVPAQYMLALSHLKGYPPIGPNDEVPIFMMNWLADDSDYVAKNYDRAVYWFRKAANQGHKESLIMLNKLNEKINEED